MYYKLEFHPRKKRLVIFTLSIITQFKINHAYFNTQITTLFIVQSNTRKPVHENSSPMGIQQYDLKCNQNFESKLHFRSTMTQTVFELPKRSLKVENLPSANEFGENSEANFRLLSINSTGCKISAWSPKIN